MSSRALAAVFRAQPRTLYISRALHDTSMASHAIASRKKASRKAAKEALRRLTLDEMAEESAAIARNLRSTGLVAGAQTMAIYVHCPKLREVDTTSTLEQALAGSGRVYAPRVLDRDANMHFLHISSLEELESVPPFGIKEPTVSHPDGSPREDIAEIERPVDLVVMPGLAFTTTGERLGRGGGYYDKFIATCRRKAEEKGWEAPLLVALAFRAQVVAEVPTDELDQLIDVLITPDGVTKCSSRGRNID